MGRRKKGKRNRNMNTKCVSIADVKSLVSKQTENRYSANMLSTIKVSPMRIVASQSKASLPHEYVVKGGHNTDPAVFLDIWSLKTDKNVNYICLTGKTASQVGFELIKTVSQLEKISTNFEKPFLVLPWGTSILLNNGETAEKRLIDILNNPTNGALGALYDWLQDNAESPHAQFNPVSGKITYHTYRNQINKIQPTAQTGTAAAAGSGNTTYGFSPNLTHLKSESEEYNILLQKIEINEQGITHQMKTTKYAKTAIKPLW